MVTGNCSNNYKNYYNKRKWMGLNDNIKRININKYNDTHIIITCYEKMIILK